MAAMWPDQTKTQELLLGARQGDDSAVNRLLDRHRQALRRMVQLRLDQKIQGRVDVSDIVQDVLVEANRRLPQYLENPAMSFHLWVRQIAKDRIIDAHRRHRVLGQTQRGSRAVLGGARRVGSLDLRAGRHSCTIAN